MKYFNLFSNILITKGANRILISDLQRNSSELYPLEFYDLIQELSTFSIEKILSKYEKSSKIIIHQYLDILLEKEYGFITLNGWDKNFPALSHDYNDCNTLSNIFIELKNISVLRKIKSSVENLDVKYITIFYREKISINDFLKIESIFDNSSLVGIEIYALYHNNIDKDYIQYISQRVKRIYNIVFYHCPHSPFRVKDEFKFTVHFTKEYLKISSCGKVDMKYFNTNLPKVLEAINHNSCLHKKISIDIEGNIKNCPLMPESFGKIKNTSLEEALAQPGFRKYWNITKDSIEGCKDCEFRYICTDCRAYTERSHYTSENTDISKPLKCGYNPYTNEWKEWSKNPLKQKAISYYELQKVK